MKKSSIALALVLILTSSTLASMYVATADNACPDQNIHTYGAPGSAAYDIADVRSTGLDDGSGGVGFVSVTDTNLSDCNGATATDPADGIPGDWDGDYDQGEGGAFFFYGTHAINDVCGYGGNVGGGHVDVSDVVFGSDVDFVVAENDQNGPIFIPVTDPVTNEVIGTVCDTPGGITPGVDSDDCISDADGDMTNGYTDYIGSGDTCGTGGGDGGFWVFLRCRITYPPLRIRCQFTTGTVTRS